MGSHSPLQLILQAREPVLRVDALALLPRGRQLRLHRAQLEEGQTTIRDRPLPGGWLLSHWGLKEAQG